MREIEKTKMGRKSQLTFFILIGFMIVIVMSFVFYVGKQSTTYKTKTYNSEKQVIVEKLVESGIIQVLSPFS